MHHPSAVRFVRAALSCALVAGVVAGCSSGRIRAGGDADLHERIAVLKDEKAELKRRALEAEAARKRAVDGGAPATDADRALAMLPRPVELRFDRFAGPRDADGDGVLDQVRVNVRPIDGRGRFVQAAGTLDVTVTAITEADGRVVELGAVRLDPDALRDAYRGGVIDTSYAVEVPIDAADLDGTTGTVTITASLRDVRNTDPVSKCDTVETRRRGGG